MRVSNNQQNMRSQEADLKMQAKGKDVIGTLKKQQAPISIEKAG